MNSKLAIVLAAVLGFAATTVVFAQEAEQMDYTNTEMLSNTMDNTVDVLDNAMDEEMGDAMENQEEAPVVEEPSADSSAPVAY